MQSTFRKNINRKKMLFSPKSKTKMNLNKDENISTNKNNNLGTINEYTSHCNKKMKNYKNKSLSKGDKEVNKKKRVANKSQ